METIKENLEPININRRVVDNNNNNNNTHIVIVEQVYFQPMKDQPIQFESSFIRLIEEDEQPYIRKTSAYITPVLIDKGWLKEKRFYTLLLKNDEELNKTNEHKTIPTIFLCIKEYISDTYITISSVSPKESIRINLHKETDYYIKSNVKGTKYTSVLFPQ